MELWDFIINSGIGVIIFVAIAGLIYFYSNQNKTGPLGLRNKHAKPFVFSLLIVTVGVLLGFMYIAGVGNELDFFSNTTLSMAAFGAGILFGFTAFIKLYRREK